MNFLKKKFCDECAAQNNESSFISCSDIATFSSPVPITHPGYHSCGFCRESGEQNMCVGIGVSTLVRRVRVSRVLNEMGRNWWQLPYEELTAD